MFMALTCKVLYSLMTKHVLIGVLSISTVQQQLSVVWNELELPTWKSTTMHEIRAYSSGRKLRCVSTLWDGIWAEAIPCKVSQVRGIRAGGTFFAYLFQKFRVHVVREKWPIYLGFGFGYNPSASRSYHQFFAIICHATYAVLFCHKVCLVVLITFIREHCADHPFETKVSGNKE